MTTMKINYFQQVGRPQIVMLISTLRAQSVLFDIAYEIALEAHEKDLRKDGKTPYMHHVDCVIYEAYMRYSRILSLEMVYKICACCALHDVNEDHPDQYPRDFIHIIMFNATSCMDDVVEVLNAVMAMTKKPKGTEPYDAYVVRVMQNFIARASKLCDLAHNMHDLNPCSMLDKYQLTYYILSNEFLPMQ